MQKSIKKAGSVLLSLPLLLVIIFSLVPHSLAANGSGEFSEGYNNELRIIFEELIFKIELGEIDNLEAKDTLASLRSKYRVDYNDFAGKIDAVIDEVEEGQKGYLDALNDFIIIQNNFAKIRKQFHNKDSTGEQNVSGGGEGNSRENN